jgi:hypothetical protein
MQNPVSDVSSQFVHGLAGERAQMLDTNDTAWTQGSGNGHWCSVENEGFSTNQFSSAQIESNAQLFAWLHQVHAVPLQLTDSTSGHGLGWHGMGGAAWGNHPGCPGSTNVALRSTILNRAIQIVGGAGPVTGGDEDMRMIQASDTGKAYIYYELDTTVNPARPILQEITGSQVGTYQFCGIPLTLANSIPWNEFTLGTVTVPPTGGGIGLTYAETVAASREGAELAEDS